MGVLDGPARSVADQLLGQFGTDVTFIARVDAEADDYDPDELSFPRASDESVTVSGQVSDFKARPKTTESDGVRQADFTVTVPANAFEEAASAVSFSAPETGHRVKFGGREHDVVDIDPLYSGDQVATYRVHVRR